MVHGPGDTSAGRTTEVDEFDLTAAFDTVYHIFCSKLSRLGVRDSGVKWFRNYLEGRHQPVKYLGTLSSPSQLQRGTPQGSLLGPVLFLVLIHDLPEMAGFNNFPSLYGGTVSSDKDVVMWISGPSVEAVEPLVESTAASLVAYMAANCLTLNLEKPQVLWINSGKMRPCVMIGESQVTPMDSIEVLGMKFDRGPGSDPHVMELSSAVSSIACLARGLKLHLPPDLVADVIRALLVGKIGYRAVAVFHPCLNQDAPRSSLIASLQIKVNDVARIICGSKKLTITEWPTYFQAQDSPQWTALQSSW